MCVCACVILVFILVLQRVLRSTFNADAIRLSSIRKYRRQSPARCSVSDPCRRARHTRPYASCAYGLVGHAMISLLLKKNQDLFSTGVYYKSVVQMCSAACAGVCGGVQCGDVWRCVTRLESGEGRVQGGGEVWEEAWSEVLRRSAVSSLNILNYIHFFAKIRKYDI